MHTLTYVEVYSINFKYKLHDYAQVIQLSHTVSGQMYSKTLNTHKKFSPQRGF